LSFFLKYRIKKAREASQKLSASRAATLALYSVKQAASLTTFVIEFNFDVAEPAWKQRTALHKA
jgi:hypothetical protein